MKRVIAAVVLVAVVVLVVAVNASAGKGKGHHSAGHTIAVVEHATTDAVTNGTAGDDVGNILTFGNDIFNAADTHRSVPIRDPVSASSWAAPGSARGRRSCHPARSPSKARSATRVTRCLRSLAGRARTATLAARWS